MGKYDTQIGRYGVTSPSRHVKTSFGLTHLTHLQSCSFMSLQQPCGIDTSIAFFACKCDSTFFALLWTPYACLLNDFSGGSGKVGQVILREKQSSLQLFNGSWMAAETEHPSCQWCRRDG